MIDILIALWHNPANAYPLTSKLLDGFTLKTASNAIVARSSMHICIWPRLARLTGCGEQGHGLPGARPRFVSQVCLHQRTLQRQSPFATGCQAFVQQFDSRRSKRQRYFQTRRVEVVRTAMTRRTTESLAMVLGGAARACEQPD